MNFGFSDEQEFLRNTAREFLERECPMSRVRELLDDPRGYRPELWAQMAELGWLGLLIPEEHGGAGLSFVDLVLVLEEQGRALLPSPFHATLQGTLAVMRAGTDAQKKEILPEVAAGRRVLTLAITEEAGTEEPEGIQLRAESRGQSFALHGTKLFVPDGQNADTLVVLGRSGQGFSLFLVDRGAPGLQVSPLQSMDQTRRIAEVRLAGTPAARLGADGQGLDAWQWVRDRALVALSADAVGGAQKTLEDAVAYAKERVQFGKPIGVHQAIKHKCADMLVMSESAKSITYYAAWAVSEQIDDAPLAAAMAKSYTSEAYRHCSAENIQIHGGVGFTWEYDCHLYFKRAKAIEVTFGDPTYHRERVAQLLSL
jgi:alkylation response protein AidB-like acyl-CoA dehydrogenase